MRSKKDPLLTKLEREYSALLVASSGPDVDFKLRLLTFREGVRLLQIKNKVEIDDQEGGIHEFAKVLNAGSGDGGAPEGGKVGGRGGRPSSGRDSGGDSTGTPIIGPAPGPDFWGTQGDDAPAGEADSGETAADAVADGGDRPDGDGDDELDDGEPHSPGRLHGARRNSDGTLRPNYNPALVGR